MEWTWVIGISAGWLCLREFNGMNIGNGPFGTMVMPLGFKEMNSGKGPLGTMGIMNIGNG